MNEISKILIFTGLLLILIGLAWQLGGKFLHLGRLPGDIIINKGNFKFYFPISTSIVISIILSLLFWLFFQFKK